MIAFAVNLATAEPAFAQSDQLGEREVAAHVSFEQDPKRAQFRNFKFPQKLIPMDGAQTFLRLRTEPLLRVNDDARQFDVEDWDIRMSIDDVHLLPREMARRFLELFSKADQQKLRPDEYARWAAILDNVDATQFSVDRSAPQYNQGVLKHKAPLIVEWDDGTTERLPPRLLPFFDVLDPGDRFGAFVKMGKKNETLRLERLSLVPVALQNA